MHDGNELELSGFSILAETRRHRDRASVARHLSCAIYQIFASIVVNRTVIIRTEQALVAAKFYI